MTVLRFPIEPQPSKQTRGPRKPTKRVSLRQARCMMEGLNFAREFPSQPQPSKQTRGPRKPTKRVSLRQARCMMEGLNFAREFPIQPQPSKQTRGPRKPTKRVSLRQARCMMEGLNFAREMKLPLNTHLIIHWGGTLEGDDAEGYLFARFRYLLDKRFRRKFGIALTGIWVRERHRQQTHTQVIRSYPRSPTAASAEGTPRSSEA